MPVTEETLLGLTAQIVSACVSHQPTAPAMLPALIADTHKALAQIAKGEPAPAPRPEPAVPVKQSVKPDHIVCLEDGKKLKTMTRYIQRRFGLSPDEYRARWGLPHDYPMTAPEYSDRRSALAKASGLGRHK